MTVLTPEWLFARAGISEFSEVAWGQKPPAREPGVYVITSDHAPDEQTVVYIGRSNNVSKRLGQFYRHIYGSRSPHRGGQEVLNLPGNRTVHWATSKDYAGVEKTMLDAFHLEAGKWPYGNKVRSAKLLLG